MNNGIKKAWQIFYKARREAPAYKKFLTKHGLTNQFKGGAQKAFLQIPITDKNNYIKAFEPFKILSKSRTAAQICASSGSSGIPTFWLRDAKQEHIGGEFHKIIFRDIYGLDNSKNTLVVICFAMGVWVAGSFTLASCRSLADSKQCRLTSVTPGIDKEDVLAILKTLAPKFEQIVLCGYPPFLTDVLTEAKKRKIKLGKKSFILASGEKISEDWRSLIFSLLNKTPDNKSVLNIYGSADAGAMAFETPLTISLRRLSLSNPKIYEKLFGNEFVTPGLYQFNPRHIYFESVNNELLLSADTAAPLIRYNIHDQGSVMDCSEIESILKSNDIKTAKLFKLLKQWALPLVIVKSRTDVAITFYSLNIYSEHIRIVLESKKLNSKVTGKFFAFTKISTTNSTSESLHINIEVKSRLKPNKQTALLCQKMIIESLTANSLEFRKLYASMGKSAWPKIKLLPYNHSSSLPKNTKILTYKNGKKAKLILNPDA